MQRFYSASTGGFYTKGINEWMPDDATPISEGIYSSLINSGKEIDADEAGQPRLKQSPQQTPSEKRASLRADVAARRWAIESAGITLPNGVSIKTATDDQLRIANVVDQMERQGYTDVPFKAATGFVRLTLEDLRGIASLVAQHVRDCWEAEATHNSAIDALHDDQLESYDVSAYWPGEVG